MTSSVSILAGMQNKVSSNYIKADMDMLIDKEHSIRLTDTSVAFDIINNYVGIMGGTFKWVQSYRVIITNLCTLAALPPTKLLCTLVCH